jgi:hypothetical protein
MQIPKIRQRSLNPAKRSDDPVEAKLAASGAPADDEDGLPESTTTLAVASFFFGLIIIYSLM